MARLQLVAALLPLCALAYQAIPDKYANNAELRAVKWMGELANPFESFPEARWEKKESPLPHERMQFFGGDDDHEDPHVEAQFRSVPKYLLDDAANAHLSGLNRSIGGVRTSIMELINHCEKEAGDKTQKEKKKRQHKQSAE